MALCTDFASKIHLVYALLLISNMWFGNPILCFTRDGSYNDNLNKFCLDNGKFA